MPTGRNTSTRSNADVPRSRKVGQEFCLLEIYSMRKTHHASRALGEEMVYPEAVRDARMEMGSGFSRHRERRFPMRPNGRVRDAGRRKELNFLMTFTKHCIALRASVAWRPVKR